MRKWSCLLLVFILLGFSEVPQVSYGQEVVKLKMADFFPIGHIAYKNSLVFIKSVHEATHGKLAIEYYPAEQLGKLKDLLHLCSQGVADIAFVPPSFYAGTLPLNTVTQLPYWTTALEGARVYRRVMAACPELSQELMRYGVRPLVVTSLSQYDVGTVKKRVRSPEDLKNLKLKTSGGLFDKIAKQYGIVPVVVPSPEIYEATQRGIIDGNILSFPSVKGYRINELEKYHTLGLRMGGYPSLWTINEKKWQKIPEDLRKALLKVAEEFSDYFANSWDEEQVNLVQQFEKEGMVIYRPPREDRAKWEAPLKGIEEIWMQDMEKKGLSARKVYAEFNRICGEVVR